MYKKVLSLFLLSKGCRGR